MLAINSKPLKVASHSKMVGDHFWRRTSENRINFVNLQGVWKSTTALMWRNENKLHFLQEDAEWMKSLIEYDSWQWNWVYLNHRWLQTATWHSPHVLGRLFNYWHCFARETQYDSGATVRGYWIASQLPLHALPLITTGERLPAKEKIKKMRRPKCYGLSFFSGEVTAMILPCFSLLKTNGNLLYIRNQFVPHSKLFPPRLQKPISLWCTNQKPLSVLRSTQNPQRKTSAI